MRQRPLTLGENIGDLGGLSMAIQGLPAEPRQGWRRQRAEQPPVIGGYTGDQRFFLVWAQIWRAKYREEATRQQLLTDPHSPPDYRINGIVRNFDEWYEAFDVGPDDALYLPPEERIRIW
jgi:putative endopeptidase